MTISISILVYSSQSWVVTKRDELKTAAHNQWWLQNKSCQESNGTTCHVWNDVRWTTKQPHLSAIVKARRFSLFGHTARMPDETDAKILTARPWRTGGDHRDTLVLREWRLSSKTWNLITSPWMKQSTWLRTVHSMFGAMHSKWCLPENKNKKPSCR